MKKFLIGLTCLILCMSGIVAVHLIVWNNFIPPQTIGFQIQGAEKNVIEASREWFDNYTEQLKGWKVPYDYRIRDAKLDNVAFLENSIVQLDYTVHTASSNLDVVSNLSLISTDHKKIYKAQIVVVWEKKQNAWIITRTMTPARYQIEMQKRDDYHLPPAESPDEYYKPQTEHYNMADEPMTYYIEDEVLYVTYDSGENFIKVPGGYEGVCKNSNGTYSELLPYNSYVITPEFTAFVDYSDMNVTLLYSTDAGKTWKRSIIRAGNYKANTFISKAENYCYVTIAVDRTGGSDYYATYKSNDLNSWTSIQLPDVCWTNLKCAFWLNDTTGYYARWENSYCITTDGGTTFEQMETPTVPGIETSLGFNPFDMVEKMYQENDTIYMVIGQGDDGDYTTDGKLIKALFQSQDGVTFEFVEEIIDTPDMAG